MEESRAETETKKLLRIGEMTYGELHEIELAAALKLAGSRATGKALERVKAKVMEDICNQIGVEKGVSLEEVRSQMEKLKKSMGLREKSWFATIIVRHQSGDCVGGGRKQDVRFVRLPDGQELPGSRAMVTAAVGCCNHCGKPLMFKGFGNPKLQAKWDEKVEREKLGKIG